MRDDGRLRLVARLTEACATEIQQRDPAAAIGWPEIPTVAAMVAHVGGVHRWVTEIVSTRRAATTPTVPDLPPDGLTAWFEAGRRRLLEVLASTPPGEPCWVIGGGPGTVAFWRRRMVFENVKHLIDLRAAGGGSWAAAPELAPADYADGIDELFTRFLPRSRPGLPLLPGSVELRATDVDRRWRIGRDWLVRTSGLDGEPSQPSATVTARAGDLALVLWERADPLGRDERFVAAGDTACVAALTSRSIHPW